MVEHDYFFAKGIEPLNLLHVENAFKKLRLTLVRNRCSLDTCRFGSSDRNK